MGGSLPRGPAGRGVAPIRGGSLPRGPAGRGAAPIRGGSLPRGPAGRGVAPRDGESPRLGEAPCLVGPRDGESPRLGETPCLVAPRDGVPLVVECPTCAEMPHVLKWYPVVVHGGRSSLVVLLLPLPRGTGSLPRWESTRLVGPAGRVVSRDETTRLAGSRGTRQGDSQSREATHLAGSRGTGRLPILGGYPPRGLTRDG